METKRSELGIGSQILLAHFDQCKKKGKKPTEKMMADAVRFNLDLVALGYEWALSSY